MEIFTKSLRGICSHLLTALLLFVLCVPLSAQNVTIGPNNGSLITGIAGGNTGDSGTGRGMSSMWRHEQLALTMTTSDIANMTSAGELADPSNAIDVRNNKLIIGAGQTNTFIVVSLPKGYRITSYTMVLVPNLSGTIQLHSNKNSWSLGTDDTGMEFYETPAWSSGTPYGTSTKVEQTQTVTDYYAKATASDGSTTMSNANSTTRAKEYTITRTSMTDTDMTNQLHFFFHSTTSNYAVTIQSFEIEFTAEGTFDVDVTPLTAGSAVSMTRSPFTTSKMDFGAITYNSDAGLYSYDFSNVRDLIAYTSIYQADAIQETEAGYAPADVATNKHISPVIVDGTGAYAFEEDTYYMEPPTSIQSASGWSNPIGFRVVGAKFNCVWGSETAAGTKTFSNSCYIHAGSANSRRLTSDLMFSGNSSNSSAVWEIDEYGNIYQESSGYRRYLACFGSGNERVLSLSGAATGVEATWNLRIAATTTTVTVETDEGTKTITIPAGSVYYLSDGGNVYYLNYKEITEGKDSHYRGYVTKDATSNLATGVINSGTESIAIPGYKPGNFTLNIYDKTGKTFESHVITEEVGKANNGAGTTYELTGLNNDAIKFSITDLADGCKAIVNVTLQLEALNPYIDNMSIICQDTEEELQLTQTFTADDFSVSGGAFVFYVPEEWKGKTMTMTFDKLYSKYSDNTYYDGTGVGNSRYNFVTSEYFTTHKNIYEDPDGVANSDYKKKVITTTSGNIRFKFNNAEDLEGAAGSLQEYFFDYDSYIGSADPDGTSTLGAYIPCQVKVGDESSTDNSGSFFLFTDDETRYNIAPTTALVHRAYAFYRMDVTLIAKTFVPKVTWTKIYDKSFGDYTYYTRDSEGNVTDKSVTTAQTGSMWGLKLDTSETIDGADGFLTYKQVFSIINQALGRTETTDDHCDVTYSNESAINASNISSSGLSDPNQVLYIDASNLMTLVETTDKTLADMEGDLGENLLVFLPVNTTMNAKNFVTKTVSGTYNACTDIVLKDKFPFYSPYNIRVDGSNVATYEREITVDKNGKVQNASVILPFALTVSDGVHTNWNSDFSFTLNTLNENNTIGIDENGMVDDADTYTGYFSPISGSTSMPNKPYMIHVTNDASDDATISFIATQKGATIEATKAMGTNYLFTGDEVSGISVDGSSYKFTNYGGYSGKEYDKTKVKIFYFANNKYVSSEYLTRATVKVYPFRAVYDYSGSTLSAKAFPGFKVAFGENLSGNATAIKNVEVANCDLAVSAGNGIISVESAIDQPVKIASMSGVSVLSVDAKAGETYTKRVPAGVYVINNKKIIVK